ncbi:hypothetical protein [Microlunatus soli]|uniref:Uncharacterized protein n=1 Tax=Microlunatus soli TaxID=630515 RepID=A0A1H1WE49_9ACTN|nr:hypothetical protein [Microlunatus soli]SDS94636.1 hypothetical protein SAMN04489812_3585 [Microlunatus soli]
MTIHLLYRSYGGENRKRRPDYYSKLLTLSSFIRAADRLPLADVIFVNDGPIPADRLELMRSAGRVISLGDVPSGMRASYRFALHLPDTEGWPDDDVVMLVEDDYLFAADSFSALADAVEDLTDVGYFALYGERADYGDPVDRRRMSVPDGWHPQPDLASGGRVWFNLASTASTFAARVGVLRSDLDIFEQCMRPFRRRFLDHETCLIVQGAIPYRGWQLITGLPDDFEPSIRGVVRTVVLIPYRVLLNRRARRQLRPHPLYCVTPNEATHLEHPVISPDRDWESIGREVTDWVAGRERGGVG